MSLLTTLLRALPFGGLLPAALLLPAQGQSQLRVIGIQTIPHQIDTVLKYRIPHDTNLSARYQLFIHHHATQTLSSKGVQNIQLQQKSLAEWHRLGSIAWYDFPGLDTAFPKEIPPGALMVWQFNGKNQAWKSPAGFRIACASLDTLLPDNSQPIYLASAVFTGHSASGPLERSVMHLVNTSAEGYSIDSMTFWQSRSGELYPFLFADMPVKPKQTFPEGKFLHPQSKSVVILECLRLPLGNAAVQVHLSRADGTTRDVWSAIKIKRETFDISAGWANDPIRETPAFLQETFLKTLKSLYVNTAHYRGQKGFTDNPDLFSRYPIKYFGNLKPWQQFDQDTLLQRIHGIEFLGEPQYGGGKPVDPQKVLLELLPFAPSRIPTTLTHSEERTWRFYAGLSDYPHFDAYRVSAPSADDWRKYHRWQGKRIGWGAPLETIGSLTRSLKALNRPAPIAYWSQGPHEGWSIYGGRKLCSPTPSELRVQAYHALASGITSLYWFNLSYSSLRKFPELMAPMQRIGREIRLLEPYLIEGNPWFFETVMEQQKPVWDLSTLVAPEGILLFVMDLDYHIDRKTKTFVFQQHASAKLQFRIPNWASDFPALLKIGPEGPRRISFTAGSNHTLLLEDSLLEAGVYLLLPDEGKVLEVNSKWQQLVKVEKALDFNPSVNALHLLLFLELSR